MVYSNSGPHLLSIISEVTYVVLGDICIGLRYNMVHPYGDHATVIMTSPDPQDLLPLPVAQLHILLALADGQKHGYAIMTEVELITEGAVTMGPGTLYGAVKRMLKRGLIEETDERPDPQLDDERRRYYQLTGLGARALNFEVARMEHLVRAAHARRASARLGLGG